MTLPRPVRIVEALAALLSAGLVVLGLVLAVLMVAAPALVDSSGLGGAPGNLLVADGPRLDRVVVQLIVGVLGEFLHLKRSRLPERARPAVAAAVILVSLAALWWGWWR